MTQSYYTIRINRSLQPLIADAEKLYRDNHKELRGIPLSKNKVLLEVLIYYLKGTKYEVKP